MTTAQVVYLRDNEDLSKLDYIVIDDAKINIGVYDEVLFKDTEQVVRLTNGNETVYWDYGDLKGFVFKEVRSNWF